MNNKKIAEIFSEIADILDIKGENPFKIRAYRKAVQAIEGLSEELRTVHDQGRLREIDGIGEAIAKKIDELLTTGKLEYYEKAKASVPDGLLAMLDVPDIGPKKVKALYEKMKIDTVEKLEKAARVGKLRELPGFGAKTEENILRGIALLTRGRERVLLGTATELAENIVAELARLTYVSVAVPAGSVRRQKETIGDIDVLVISREPKKVMDAFVSLDCIGAVIARGATKSSIRTKDNVQVDVRVVERKSFGAALQYFTGSKAHNIELRESAMKRGLKVNEYGVFGVKSEKMVAGKSEEEVYGALDLPVIPPELREGMGEIEAARAGELPQLLELEHIKGDLHVHTDWSDGKHSIEQVTEACRSLGYKYVGIADHSQSLSVANGLTPDELAEQVELIRKINRGLKGFRVLAGAEVDILSDGSLDFPDELLARLDFVIAAIHSGFKQGRKQLTDRIRSAMEHPCVSILAHPTCRLIGRREPLDINVVEILDIAKETGTAVELNAHQMRLDLNDVHLRKAKDLGVKASIGTDTHVLEELKSMRYGVATARRGWLGPNDVLNTLPASRLLKALRPAQR
jgi:DNA polymerase (family 10)